MTAPDADNLKFKIYKLAGNDIFVKEVVQNLNLKAKQWILDFFKNCARLHIFGEWRKEKSIALPKLNNDPQNPKTRQPK